jgi:xanthine dehydrogenase small subunit
MTLKRFSRTANDIAVVNTALAARVDAGSLEDVRVALGGLGPCAVRAEAVEKALEGFPVSGSLDDFAEGVSRALLGSISPVDDVRGSASFKTRVAGALLLEALREISSPGGLS